MAATEPKVILVVANETVAGGALIDAVVAKAHASHEEMRPFEVVVICPQNQPRSGSVIFEDTVREAAQNRLEMTLAQLRNAGIHAEGHLVDPDPYAAVMDYFSEHGADEIIISTHPATRSGWLRRDLIERVRGDTGVPVEHVVVDHEADREEGVRMLVVANQTVGGEPLIQLLEKKAAEAPHSFIVICPQGEDTDENAYMRLAHTLKRLDEEGLQAVGQVTHPDPYTAIQQALQYYAIDEIAISTFPSERSGWLRSNLVERVRSSTAKPVEHVVVTEAEAEEGARS